MHIASTARANSFSFEELEVFERVKKVMLEKTKVPCTGCAYCMPCPYGVNIPGCFSVYNDKYLLNIRNYRWKYLQVLGVTSKKPAYASLCTECGKCERHCPQNIPIRQELKVVKKEMEGILFNPFVKIARRMMRV
jgi:predicted aldo/keto reductase-like oxidoreductase